MLGDMACVGPVIPYLYETIIVWADDCDISWRLKTLVLMHAIFPVRLSTPVVLPYLPDVGSSYVRG